MPGLDFRTGNASTEFVYVHLSMATGPGVPGPAGPGMPGLEVSPRSSKKFAPFGAMHLAAPLH